MKDINFVKFGRNIAAARKAAGMTQKQLSEACGQNEQRICHIETGLREPSLKLTYRIATVLGTNIDKLIG